MAQRVGNQKTLGVVAARPVQHRGGCWRWVCVVAAPPLNALRLVRCSRRIVSWALHASPQIPAPTPPAPLLNHGLRCHPLLTRPWAGPRAGPPPQRTRASPLRTAQRAPTPPAVKIPLVKPRAAPRPPPQFLRRVSLHPTWRRRGPRLPWVELFRVSPRQRQPRVRRTSLPWAVR